MKGQSRGFPGPLNFIILFLLALLVVNAPVSAATTSVHLVKYADDRTTVLQERTVDYQWMEKNLPVKGDGVTHYYHQGPVFNGTTMDERWDPNETENVITKDMGAVKGTDLRNLCDLLGGMSDGDTVKIQATDGFYKEFPYVNVYEPQDRQGPMVVTWYKNGQYPGTGYSEGMRLVFFADTSTNPFGVHAFGNYDWHEAADSVYWYYYQSGGEKYPTTTGLSVQYISDIIIFSQEPTPEPLVAAFSATPLSGEPPLTVSFSDLSTGIPVWWNWTFGDGSTSDAQNPSYTYNSQGQFSITLKASNKAGNSTTTLEDYISVSTATVSFEPDDGGNDQDANGDVTSSMPAENATIITTHPTGTVVTTAITMVNTTDHAQQQTPVEVMETGETVTTAPAPTVTAAKQVTTATTIPSSPPPAQAPVPDKTVIRVPQNTVSNIPFLDQVMKFIEKLLNLFE